MSILFKDDQFDFQVLRLLGETVYCAADIGEVVSTSNRITEGDLTQAQNAFQRLWNLITQ